MGIGSSVKNRGVVVAGIIVEREEIIGGRKAEEGGELQAVAGEGDGQRVAGGGEQK